MINNQYIERLKKIIQLESFDSDQGLFIHIIKSLIKYIDYLRAQINHYQIIESHDKWATLEASKTWAILTNKNYWDLRERDSAIKEAEKIKKYLIEFDKENFVLREKIMTIENEFLKHLGFDLNFGGGRLCFTRGPLLLSQELNGWVLNDGQQEHRSPHLLDLIKVVILMDKNYVNH